MNDEAVRGGWVWIHGSSFLIHHFFVNRSWKLGDAFWPRRAAVARRFGGAGSTVPLGPRHERCADLKLGVPEYLLRGVTIPSPNNANKVGARPFSGGSFDSNLLF